MAYEKFHDEWANYPDESTPLSAGALDHIEDGISSVATQVDNLPAPQKGDKGEKGDTGAKGDKGDPGDTGPAGPPGVDGTDGTNGTNGDPGPAGADGTDGTDGFPTEEQWNALQTEVADLQAAVEALQGAE